MLQNFVFYIHQKTHQINQVAWYIINSFIKPPLYENLVDYFIQTIVSWHKKFSWKKKLEITGPLGRRV